MGKNRTHAHPLMKRTCDKLRHLPQRSEELHVVKKFLNDSLQKFLKETLEDFANEFQEEFP